jgi:hypothetical protein
LPAYVILFDIGGIHARRHAGSRRILVHPWVIDWIHPALGPAERLWALRLVTER